MLASQTLTVKASELRQELGDLALKEDTADDAIEQKRAELKSTETRYRAALEAEGGKPDFNTGDGNDPEKREVEQLRQRASLGSFIESRIRGRMVDGAEEEYRAATGASYGAIPLGMLEPRERAVSGSPTTGTPVNAESVVPYVFSSSLAGVLGVEVRSAAPGTFSVPRITTPPATGANPVATGGTTDETAGVMDIVQSTPRRLPASVRTNIESIWTLGAAYEDAFRESMRMQLSAALDNQLINGAAAAPAMNGLITQVGLPSAARGAVETWKTVVDQFVDQIDGLWASELSDLFLVTHPDGYKFASKVYLAGTGNQATPGDVSAVEHLQARSAGVRAHTRMPATYTSGTLDDHVAVLFARRGQGDITRAVMPTWGELVIDDPYTSAATGERVFTFVMGVGALILVHSAAYEVVVWQVA